MRGLGGVRVFEEWCDLDSFIPFVANAMDHVASYIDYRYLYSICHIPYCNVILTQRASRQ